MKERPILFSGPMVRAILDDRKTQTRRVVKASRRAAWRRVEPVYFADKWTICAHPGGGFAAVDMPDAPPERFTWIDSTGFPCPYGAPGDRLWVRETWASAYSRGCWGTLFAADGVFVQGKRRHERGPHFDANADGRMRDMRWKPSIHMPRWASRITLEITDVRVERVEDISDRDARSEGFDGADGFLITFYDLNHRAPRGSNPWVWALTFRRVDA